MNFQKLLGAFWPVFLSFLMGFCSCIFNLPGTQGRQVQLQNG